MFDAEQFVKEFIGFKEPTNNLITRCVDAAYRKGLEHAAEIICVHCYNKVPIVGKRHFYQDDDTLVEGPCKAKAILAEAEGE